MYLNHFIAIILDVLLAVSASPAKPPKRYDQVCAGIDVGTGCTMPNYQLCCKEDMVTVIKCNATAQIEFLQCTNGRICAPDGKAGIACFVPGTQPIPPS